VKIGPRQAGPKVILVRRPWNDVAPELQRKLDAFDDLAAVTNALIAAFEINVSGSTTVVEPAESVTDWFSSTFLMGA
jgi:hypothetical protein